MASTSENTFGSKIANAQTIATHLKTFTGYVAPTTDISIANYNALITSVKIENDNLATKQAAYSAAVNTRQKHFTKEATSIDKILSPIIANLKAKMGKSAKEVTTINALITKIRGVKTKKLKPEDKATIVSQSERSYGSITQNFSTIVTTLSTLGTNYAPVKPNLKLTALKTKITDITTANNTVTTTYNAVKTSVDSRNSKYKELAEKTQRIKEAVKSQYGTNSSEYKLIKGLKV